MEAIFGRDVSGFFARRTATRFDRWTRSRSILAFLLLLCLVVFSILSPYAPRAGAKPQGGGQRDSDLYRSAIEAVSRGENYYAFIVAEHRLRNYPLKPFFTVRSPVLAVVSGTLGQTATRGLFIALISATLFAWYARLKSGPLSPVVIVAAIVMLSVCCASLNAPVLLIFHESWAALLIALSLALRTPQRFGVAILIGVIATLVRELSIAYLVLMLVFALGERRWREGLGWALAIAACALWLALHAHIIGLYTVPGDLASPGWNGRGGWPFYLSAIQQSTLMTILPDGLARALAPLCLFGWLALRWSAALRVSALLSGYALLLMLFARPDNLNWALLEVPLLLAGLIFAVPGIGQLVENIRRPAQ